MRFQAGVSEDVRLHEGEKNRVGREFKDEVRD